VELGNIIGERLKLVLLAYFYSNYARHAKTLLWET
jgi:hypothetical protein